MEALYPSLEAIEVADIVYNAMMETNIKFDNINWVEACKYRIQNRSVDLDL